MNAKLPLQVLIVFILLTACGAPIERTEYPPCDIITRDDGPLGGGPQEVMCSSPTGRYTAHVEFLPVPGGRTQGAISAFTITDTDAGTSARQTYHHWDFFAWSLNEDYLILGGAYASASPCCWTDVLTADGVSFVHNPPDCGMYAWFEPLEFRDNKLIVSECWHADHCYAIDLTPLPDPFPDDFYLPLQIEEEVPCD